MKACNKCGIEKPLEMFGFRSIATRKRHARCLECMAAVARAERLENPDAVRVREQRRHAKDKGKRNAASEAYSAVNRDRLREIEIAWRQRNTARVQAACKAWREENRGRVNALVLKRKMAKADRTPAWADHAAIREFYELAAFLSKTLGEPFHVDHVIPLQGKTVSGLHVHTNLQILPATENIRKHNRFGG